MYSIHQQKLFYIKLFKNYKQDKINNFSSQGCRDIKYSV